MNDSFKERQSASRAEINQKLKGLEGEVREAIMQRWGARLVEHILRECELRGYAKIGIEVHFTLTPRSEGEA